MAVDDFIAEGGTAHRRAPTPGGDHHWRARCHAPRCQQRHAPGTLSARDLELRIFVTATHPGRRSRRHGRPAGSTMVVYWVGQDELVIWVVIAGWRRARATRGCPPRPDCVELIRETTPFGGGTDDRPGPRPGHARRLDDAVQAERQSRGARSTTSSSSRCAARCRRPPARC